MRHCLITDMYIPLLTSKIVISAFILKIFHEIFITDKQIFHSISLLVHKSHYWYMHLVLDTPYWYVNSLLVYVFVSLLIRKTHYWRSHLTTGMINFSQIWNASLLMLCFHYWCLKDHYWHVQSLITDGLFLLLMLLFFSGGLFDGMILITDIEASHYWWVIFHHWSHYLEPQR